MIPTLSIALMIAAAAPTAEPSTVELKYSGTLSPVVQGDVSEPVKRFTVYAAIITGESGRDVAFSVDEDGAGEQPWPLRFGVLQSGIADGGNADGGNQSSPASIRLLFSHDGTRYPIEIPNPIFHAVEKMASGATWVEGRREYEIGRDREVNGRKCRQVTVQLGAGRNQTLWVDPSSAVVVSADQRVFVGRGDQYRLSLKLESETALSVDSADRIHRATTALLHLQQAVNFKTDSTRPELSRDQLATAGGALDELKSLTDDTPYAGLTAEIRADVRRQQQRLDEVGSIGAAIVGKKIDDVNLQLISGKPLDPADITNRITVLHFWEYRDEPLVEPYGQVGYLDFLHNKHRRLGVRVYGVAVDSRFADAATAGGAARAARKLREFMNVGYEIASDDGTLLQRFGDPRRHGADLPVWIVLAPDGTVAHYHAGFYEIDPREGLRDLNAVVVRLIQQSRTP